MEIQEADLGADQELQAILTLSASQGGLLHPRRRKACMSM